MKAAKNAQRVAGKVRQLVENFMVIYNDDDCLKLPMGFDNDCEGAICVGADCGPFALFPNRKAARRAISISTRFALLRREQGKPVNEDFIGDCLKNVKIIPCVINISGQRCPPAQEKTNG